MGVCLRGHFLNFTFVSTVFVIDLGKVVKGVSPDVIRHQILVLILLKAPLVSIHCTVIFRILVALVVAPGIRG